MSNGAEHSRDRTGLSNTPLQAEGLLNKSPSVAAEAHGTKNAE